MEGRTGMAEAEAEEWKDFWFGCDVMDENVRPPPPRHPTASALYCLYWTASINKPIPDLTALS